MSVWKSAHPSMRSAGAASIFAEVATSLDSCAQTLSVASLTVASSTCSARIPVVTSSRMWLSSLFFITSPKMIPNDDSLLCAFAPLRELRMPLQISANLFAQTRARPMQRHTHHQRRCVHDVCDFAVAEALKVTQGKHLCRGRSQP